MEERINRKWDTEKFSKKVKEISSDYELVSEYNSNHTKVKMRHLVCGNIYEVTPTNFLRNVGWCSYCAQKQRIKTMTKDIDTFKDDVYSRVQDEYTVISDYVNTNTKISFIHSICNHEFRMTPSNFLQGQRCPFCNSSVSKRYTNEQAQELITNKLEDTYILQSDYKNNHTKIDVFHVNCKKIWKTTLRDILAGNRCPLCTAMSKGEEKIFNYLKTKNESSIFQYRIDDCKNILPLPFDFYVPAYKLLIEYDGRQHFEPIFGKDTLEKTIKNDNIKNQFCLDNSDKYNFIRIPYTEFDNIENILEEKINNIKNN